jgi:O-antigen ligase
MNSVKPLQWAGVALGSCLAFYLVYTHAQYFSDAKFLGGILLLEVIIASVWKFDQRFLVLLLMTFVWAGMDVPLQSAWTAGRWVVLATGALVGCIVWIRAPHRPFQSIHLIALFCICAAFVSATVSSFIQIASLKALSLALLFLYCAAGARLAVLGREDRFFRGVVWGSEIAVYITAICYFALGRSIWGNPNSLGAAMSIGVFPILLWAWLTSHRPVVKVRRLVALLLCAYLVRFSMERAGMASVILVSVIVCVCLHHYKLLMKMVALSLFLIAVIGMWAPETLNNQLGDLKDAVLYKGHKEEGVMGSRRTPWENSIASIKEHPLFGMGYGTSPTGESPGLKFGNVSTTAAAEREHGSSYITIAEWVGLFGGLPFVTLLAMTVANVWKVCAWMNRTADPSHYSIPLAMVVVAGLCHASFEDWLFAVGSYICVYFWVFAFLLADLVPDAVVVPAAGAVSLPARPLTTGFGSVVPNR